MTLKYAECADRPIGHDHVVAEDALERRPDPGRAVRDRSLREWVLNSTRFAPSVSNAWVSWRSFASRLAPLRWKAVPTHVQPISSRRCSGTIDRKRLLPIARPDAWSMVANGRSVPASALARAVSTQRAQARPRPAGP